MDQFSLEDSNRIAWLLLSFDKRNYAGNRGYADVFSKVYEYHGDVPNSKQISKGDLVLLQDKENLLGVARIEQIDISEGNKDEFHCPACNSTKLNKRKIYQPKFRCYSCRTEFEEPNEKHVDIKLFTAHFENTFVAAKGAISIEALRRACLTYNKQMSMQRLDFNRIEATLLAQAPAVQPLLTDYLKADAADNVHYSPKAVDGQQFVMRQIRVRRGQEVFRQALRNRYGDQCMITGCQLLDILEAAHIKPYRDGADNRPENGLLLRADLHTLFDLNLLGINPESLQVQFHPAALATGYDLWEGGTLLCSKIRPSQAAFESRWERFQTRLQSTG